MNKYFSSLAFVFALGCGTAIAEESPEPGCEWEDCQGTSVGPAPCVPRWICPVSPPATPETPVGPSVMCLGPAGCFPVTYKEIDGGFVIAESVIPAGYPVIGWAGPCFFERGETCPDLGNQAFSDLRMNALRIHRGLRYEGVVE